jgi:hypothetical protein
MNEQEKKVDDEWKEQVAAQKRAADAPNEPAAAQKRAADAPNEPAAAQKQPADGAGEAAQPSEAEFSFFITSLALQASIALGAIPNPVTQKSEENIEHARLIIDTLGMLREKTRGNLSTEEDSIFDNYLYELRMQYLAKTRGKV